jgi:hypothetical protein
MCGDDLSHGICVHQACEEDKGNEMVVQNLRVEVEVSWNQSPGHEEWDEAKESATRLVTAISADFDDIEGAFQCQLAYISYVADSRLDRIQHQNKSTLDHIPLVKWKVVYILGNESVFRYSHSGKHRLLPEAGSSLYSCERVYGN